MKRGSVVVGTLDPGEWSASFGLSLVDLLLTDAMNNGRIVPNGMHLRKFCSTGGLVSARNELARDFLDRTDGEWLFMVDTDMGFAPDTVDRLVAAADQYHRPVVGGLCFAQKRAGRAEHHVIRYRITPTVYSFVETETEVGFLPMFGYTRDAQIRVAGTGAACLLVHRRALHKVREKYGDVWFEPVTHPTGPTTFSEDLSFCVRLAACDVPIYVHTGVTTSHDKGGIFLDEAAYDAQPPLEQLTKE